MCGIVGYVGILVTRPHPDGKVCSLGHGYIPLEFIPESADTITVRKRSQQA
jgi:hypothetical protein